MFDGCGHLQRLRTTLRSINSLTLPIKVLRDPWGALGIHEVPVGADGCSWGPMCPEGSIFGLRNLEGPKDPKVLSRAPKAPEGPQGNLEGPNVIGPYRALKGPIGPNRALKGSIGNL